jgi:hypothetical protein
LQFAAPIDPNYLLSLIFGWAERVQIARNALR